MKRNFTLNFAFALTLILFLAQSKPLFAQIANGYLNDIGIENNTDVVFTEMFEETSISNMITASNYNTSSVMSNFSFDASVPLGSVGTQSCKLTTIEGTTMNEDTYLFKRFPVGINDSVFVRYYIKYNNAHTFHHSGVWMGGNNPPTAWPNVNAGYKPAGNSAFHIGSEIRGATQNAQNNAQFGLYNYWMNMHQSTQINPGTGLGYYWGNDFLSPNPIATLDMTQWNCIEVMVKMNNPVSNNNGELALWINGVKIAQYSQGNPSGTWNDQIFNEGPGGTFEGFQWRDDPALLFNYIWIKNYATLNASHLSPNDLWFDHIVVAKKYIGPINTNLGVNNNTTAPSFNVYPNPANDIIRLSRKVSQIKIFNANGQLVISIPKETENISTKDLPNGIYIIQAENYSQKIIVAH